MEPIKQKAFSILLCNNMYEGKMSLRTQNNVNTRGESNLQINMYSMILFLFKEKSYNEYSKLNDMHQLIKGLRAGGKRYREAQQCLGSVSFWASCLYITVCLHPLASQANLNISLWLWGKLWALHQIYFQILVLSFTSWTS